MVDAIVSFVVKRLGDLLIEKAVFLQGVTGEVTWLKDELKSMQRFLKDAEEKQYEDPTTFGWVSDIRELAYDIEELLDTYQLKVHGEAEDDEETTEEKPKSRCFPSMCSCIFDKGKGLVNQHCIGKEIKEFKNRLTACSSRRERYALKDSGGSRDEGGRNLLKLKELREINSSTIEENVVGLKDDADKLLTKLLEDEPRRFVISIVGMGGLGKTTLAKKLYHNRKVKMKFTRRAWVSVSQDYTARDLLVRILVSFGTDQERKDLEKMNVADLGKYLRDSLQEYSYLVVTDDVWDKEVWKSLESFLPDNKQGSRVIITTRNQQVVAEEGTHLHNLRKLRSNESWQLFCEKIFVSDFNTNDQLKNLGREMVQKCDGLPLSIIVLAGLLSTKKAQDWCVVRDHLWQHLKDGSIEVRFLLTLSFDFLPYPLKQCFLYLGFFPEDSQINVEKLIRLWVAEGFIPLVEDHIMEEVAKDYVDQLISRSLIQVGRRYWGRIATCRVHDLLRELAIEKAKSFDLYYIYDESKHVNILPTLSSCLRLATYSGVENPLWFENYNPRLRSLLLFAQEQQVVPMFKKFNSLRVLDVHCRVELEEESMFAKEITKLIHLKYLGLTTVWYGLSSSSISKLSLSSSSISKLRRLQTLDTYSYACRVKLPAEIGELQELRHLIGDFANCPLQIGNLTKLQTLKYVRANGWSQIKTTKLVNLRELWIRRSDDDTFSFDSMSNLKSLRILSVQPPHNDISFASLQPLSHCQHLIELRLDGKLEKLPIDMHILLPNLQLLSLWESQLEDDPMPLLEKLPCLTILSFDGGFYNGRKMMCSDGGFPLLEILIFNEVFFEIEEWQVGEKALPRLRGLRIPENIKLKIPERLRSLPTPGYREYSHEMPDKLCY